MTEKEPQVPAAAFTELVSEWHKVNGVRPQGASVGMTVASDGAIWLVEDKNVTVIRSDLSPGTQTEQLPCGARTDKQIDQLVAYVHADDYNRQRLRQMRTQLVEKHCVGCHSDFASVRSRTTDRGTMPYCDSRCRRIAGSGLDTLASSGSCHRAKAAAFH